MGRIAVGKSIAEYLTDPVARAEIDDLLDYDIPPRGLSGSDLRKWLYKSYDADQTREAFAVLMEDLYFATWNPAISEHIPFSSTRRLAKLSGSDIALLEKTIDALSRRYEDKD